MDLERDRRLRNYTLIPLVVIGIVAGALLGIGFGLGMYGEGAATRGNPAGIVFFIAPPAVCAAIGWIAYRVARRLTRDRAYS